LLMALFAWSVLRAPRVAHDTLDVAYARLCGKLARAGAPPQAAEGPTALAARVGALWPRHDLASLLAAYSTLRYGFANPPAGEVLALAKAITSLRLPSVQPDALSSATQ